MANIIPLPAFSQEQYGEFILNAHTTVYADNALIAGKTLFVSIIENACGYTLSSAHSKNSMIRFLHDRKQPEEGYKIVATSENIFVYASGFSGVFNSVQTLRQLLCADIIENAKVLTMHATVIEDKPRFKWRAIMLDESRHFFGMDMVKKLLDLMAIHKLNVFHWHLTDNQGWRVEIKKYPKLTEVGAYRAGTQLKAWGKKDIEWTPYGNYYTQEEITEIVKYAKERNIMVVPEIDMPAHFGSALSAYPHLSCTEKAIEPPVSHGYKEHSAKHLIACAGKNTTFQFIYDVIDEICQLFPAPYFHIGGDEAPKTEWKSCAYCQQTIKDNQLENEEALQGYFNNKIALYLTRKGKRMIGWNEILTCKNLESSIIAQYWVRQRDKNVENHLALGRDAIISKHQSFYFDMPYAYRNLKDTYNFMLSDYAINENDTGIMGVEGTLWSEWIPTQERLEYQLFPRMEALAEVAWSPVEKRDYACFRKRLKIFLQVLDRRDVAYAPESMVDARGVSARHIYRIFNNKDAHIEYRKAMSKNRRYK